MSFPQLIVEFIVCAILVQARTSARWMILGFPLEPEIAPPPNPATSKENDRSRHVGP
jgi:hypothetical protein